MVRSKTQLILVKEGQRGLVKGQRQAWQEGGGPEGKSRMMLANENLIDSLQNPTPPRCGRFLRAK